MEQDFAEIADNRDVGGNIFVDLGGIDIHVDFLGVLRVGFKRSGDAIVETHSESEQQVRFLNCFVDPRFSVHAHHAETERMRSRKRANPKKRESYRCIRRFRKGEQFAFGAGKNYAMTREDDGAASFANQMKCFGEISIRRWRAGAGTARAGRGGVPVEWA